MSTQLAESPIPTSPPSPSAPPAPSPGQLPAQSSPPLRKFQPHGALCHRPCSQSSVCFPTLSLWLYAGHTCVFVGVLHQDKLPGGAAAAAAFGGAPGGTRASLDAEPEMELRKPALCCGGSSPQGPLLGVRVLSSGEAGGRGEAEQGESRSPVGSAHPRGSSGPGDTADSFRFEAGGAELLNTRDPNNRSLAAGCPPSLCV